MKKPKKPGDNISIKTKKNESPLIVDWINCQTNLMDSIRYLIENEVAANGIRNLQNYIPAERAFSTNGDSLIANNNGLIANFRNAEVPATKVESLTTNETAIRKEPEKLITDDDIDDEDIESWT
ncbi:hypothetical protein [Brevibacillus choshinensis]|uniref:hypothetical protein n=1 Tax=Brevibacillus choshinensis TaxID=54911 RepID=UPI002E21A10B|nr:hypothetical protein [Brevibacillus choshinensis]MED4751751.1 hypothetical protein [Brevibacillus choshinensis]MED4780009.1 hypothetical protein [Brevibacillus choshinensis]